MTPARLSFFRRNVLLLHALLMLSLACGAMTLREWVQKPRITELAGMTALQIRLARAYFLLVPERERESLTWLKSRPGIELLPVGAAGSSVDLTPRLPAARQFVADLRRQLPDALDARWVPIDHGTVWVRMRLGSEQYWFIERGLFLEGNLPAAAIGTLLIIAVLSVWGAALIQRRINRPLSRLVEAAKTLAAGSPLTPLSEDGPEEFALVSRAFNQMTASLKRADAERAVLLAGVSHDLRTPIAKLRLAIEMLAGASDGSLVDSMRRSTAELEAVTEQFLHYARGEAPGDLVPTNLNSIVLESAERHQESAREHEDPRGIRTRLGTPCSLPLHPESIRRALDNLIQNAVRYGGGMVEVEADFRDGVARVSVLDRGPGIPPDEVQVLKTPFFRGRASSGTPGAGLGLAIVERIARAHHARFELLPREGGGLEARLEFARAERITAG